MFSNVAACETTDSWLLALEMLFHSCWVWPGRRELYSLPGRFSCIEFKRSWSNLLSFAFLHHAHTGPKHYFCVGKFIRPCGILSPCLPYCLHYRLAISEMLTVVIIVSFVMKSSYNFYLKYSWFTLLASGVEQSDSVYMHIHMSYIYMNFFFRFFSIVHFLFTRYWIQLQVGPCCFIFGSMCPLISKSDLSFPPVLW